jgi:hypothetical protein
VAIRRIPVDLGKLSGFTCAWAPEPDLEFDSEEQKRDRESDLPLYVVGVNVRLAGTREADCLKIQVPGLPVGVEENQVVKVYDLTASHWTQPNGRSGINYRASAITPANAPAPPAAAAVPPESPEPGKAPGGRRASRE